MGPCSRPPAVSVPGVQTDLRSVDGYPLGGASSQGPVAFLPGKILRGRIGQKGRLALRHQQESRLPLAASFSGPALGPPGLPGGGIVEADETYFLRSFKGQRHLPRCSRKRSGRALKRGLSFEQVPVLTVRDRSGATSDAILPKDDHQAIEVVLKPLLAPDAVLCTDGGGKGPFALAAREMGLAHRAVNLRKGIRVLAGVYHTQNVNAYHSRLKGWMQRFHGVATKYLAHYLGWRRMLERFGDHLNSALWLTLSIGHQELQHDWGT